jgi:hypothetical protein
MVADILTGSLTKFNLKPPRGAKRGPGASDLNGRFAAANLTWSLVEIGHQPPVRSLLQFSGLFAVVSRKQPFDRRHPVF